MLGPLFDVHLGEKERDQALCLVGENAGRAFMDAAKALIIETFSGQEVLAEQFRRVCEEHGIRPHHHNAWGSLTNELVRAGILIDTGRTRKSTWQKNHAHRYTVWKVR